MARVLDESCVIAFHAFMKYDVRFAKLVDDAKRKIREISCQEVADLQNSSNQFVLIDIREESEFAKSSIPGAIYVGRGILERDIEKTVTAAADKIVLYCGGGGRSALSAESLQKMGYTNVWSMAGGFRGWAELGLPTLKK